MNDDQLPLKPLIWILDRLVPPSDRLVSWLDRQSTFALLLIGMALGAGAAMVVIYTAILF